MAGRQEIGVHSAESDPVGDQLFDVASDAPHKGLDQTFLVAI